MGTMTHYMELLATNQPWNLLLFMAVPVICAETLAITEFIILLTRNFKGTARKINKATGLFAGIYFLGVFIYLFINAVIPLTTGAQWHGVADVIAVGFYLFGIVPLGGLSLLELGLLGRNKTQEQNIVLHATLVSIFLVTAHVAMIFGMLDPTLLTHNMSSGMKM